MKRNIIIIVCILFMLTGRSQELIHISGHVLDIETLAPVEAHPVMYEMNQWPGNIIFTDENGYFEDTVNLAGLVFEFMQVSTFDCYGLSVVKTFNQPLDSIYMVFEICTDSLNNFCEAFFMYETAPANPFELQFTSLSTGPFDRWHWDFGDGIFSEELNPLHNYSAPGDYNVCLTIYSADSLNSICYDLYCEDLWIDDTLSCHADFITVLDSNSGVQNVYQFFNSSQGNINSWYWDFGD